MNVAVLIATFKRKSETRKCLKKLFQNNFNVDIYISDSNSRNNIQDLKKDYPNIDIVNVGDNVFWNRGMNYSWAKAEDKKEYDYYIWLNNDTYLYSDALKTIFNDLKIIKSKSIIVGITQDKEKLTYGVRNDLKDEILSPIGVPQKVKYINGNFVLIPRDVFISLGFLDNVFTHSLGDIDYGLRALNSKIGVYCTSKVVGFCEDNSFEWYDYNSLFLRLKNFNRPKGTPIKEYFYFNKNHFGYIKAIKFLVAVIIAIISPKLYKLLSIRNN